jgi:zinc protease
MLSRGSKTLSREQIARRLDELKARLQIGGGAQSLTVRANTTREHLPALLELIEELLQRPAFPDSEFEQLRAQSITGVESQLSEPQAIAGLELRRLGNDWPKGHPLYAPTFDEQLETLRSLTLEEVRQFHRDFHGSGSGEIALVGDFDAEQITEDLETRFGDWTSEKSFARIADPFTDLAAQQISVETPDKANAVILMVTGLPIDDSHPDYPALVAGNYVFGGGSLKSRLADRVRQKDGLSYGVAAQFSADSIDASATQLMFAIAAPENIEKVEAAFREELALLLKDGITEAELKDAVDGWLKSRQRARGEDGALLGMLADNAYLDRTMAWSAELDAKVAALTVGEVNAALRRHLDPGKYSVIAVGDFAKLKAAASDDAAE